MSPLARTASAAGAQAPASPFAGADICLEAGLALPPDAARPVFEDDEWNFTDVIGLPVQMSLAKRRFDFTAIRDQRWRTVAKELIVAMLAPLHEAVAPLPRAYRTPAHLGTAKLRLDELTRWLNWLTRQGIRSLSEVDEDCCAAWLIHRRHALDESGTAIGDRSPATRRAAAQVVIDLLNYRELFTADRLRRGLRPWGGASASAVAVKAMPMPATTCGRRKAYQAELGWAISAIEPMPPANSTRPSIRMYLPPIRSDIRPATGATNIETSEAGAIVRPALSAEKPSTDCR